MRVSGGEPTIGELHLLQPFDHLEGKWLLFILETNGVLIGNDQKYVQDLAKNSFVHVRVSLKGCSEDEFVTLTGASPEGFGLQLRALENLVRARVKCHPAVMTSFSTRQSLQQPIERLRGIRGVLAEELEIEELVLYPSVKRKIKKHGLRYYSAYTP